METTHGKRVQLLREAKGYKSLTGFAEHTGLKVGTLSALEGNKSAPSMETLVKLLAAFPDLNLDWLVGGTGSMLRDGCALTAIGQPTPAPPAEPAPDYTTAAGTIDAAYLAVLKEQIGDLKADKQRLLDDNLGLREENRLLLGKPSGSADAADEDYGTPTGPLPRLRVEAARVAGFVWGRPSPPM